MARRLHIALLIESSRAYGRGLLRGIASYVRDHGHWTVFHQERGMSDEAPDWFRHWEGDGVIARIESRTLIESLRHRGLPTVDLRGMHDIRDVPLIETNDRKIVQLAVDHLRERGFENFAYCGFAGANFSKRRLSYFVPLVEQAGYKPIVYEGTVFPAGEETAAIEGQSLVYEAALERWIQSLPRPVAVMACNDVRAQQVINACRDLDIGVPEDVAVIGVDNDELICDLCDPPLSSVMPDTHQIGYSASEMLDGMIRGKPPLVRKMFINPLEVVARRSTEVSAIADRQIAKAIRFIHENACEGIDVNDVLQKLSISRSTLERRFMASVGRSPREEISQVQMRRVKQLLRETTFTLDRIAHLTGFKHLETMCSKFKRETRKTPGQFRDSLR